MVTTAPALSNAVAMPLPMPTCAPVTIAALPSNWMPMLAPQLTVSTTPVGMR